MSYVKCRKCHRFFSWLGVADAMWIVCLDCVGRRFS